VRGESFHNNFVAPHIVLFYFPFKSCQKFTSHQGLFYCEFFLPFGDKKGMENPTKQFL
jgi:hypothetical protein